MFLSVHEACGQGASRGLQLCVWTSSRSGQALRPSKCSGLLVARRAVCPHASSDIRRQPTKRGQLSGRPSERPLLDGRVLVRGHLVPTMVVGGPPRPYHGGRGTTSRPAEGASGPSSDCQWGHCAHGSGVKLPCVLVHVACTACAANGRPQLARVVGNYPYIDRSCWGSSSDCRWRHRAHDSAVSSSCMLVHDMHRQQTPPVDWGGRELPQRGEIALVSHWVVAGGPAMQRQGWALWFSPHARLRLWFSWRSYLCRGVVCRSQKLLVGHMVPVSRSIGLTASYCEPLGCASVRCTHTVHGTVYAMHSRDMHDQQAMLTLLCMCLGIVHRELCQGFRCYAFKCTVFAR